jgi:hypothetical protein
MWFRRIQALPFTVTLAVWTLAASPSWAEVKATADHWAFQPLQRPPLPTVRKGDWIRNPIDGFVLARLEAAGLEPAEPAPQRQLARRAHLDLLGLPPEPDDLDTFVVDSTENAYEKLIDKLLANPHYGERWGRHWLDLVRYADTNGYEVDGVKPFVWRYRDYVIRALNTDKPYDRFVLEQLAGDELPDRSSETVIATGFYRLGTWDAERGASAQKSEKVIERYNELDDMVSTTSQVFLGLTLGCARCHDHKFDPLTQVDYYSMAAIFNPLVRHHAGRAELSLPAGNRPQVEAWTAAKHRATGLEKEVAKLRQQIFLDSRTSKLPVEVLEAYATPPEARNENEKKLTGENRKNLTEEITNAFREQEFCEQHASRETCARIARLEEEIRTGRKKYELPEGYFLHEPSPEPPVMRLLIRGNPKSEGAEVGPAVPAVLASSQLRFDPPDTHTTRQRISLARWITSAKNTLTPRVIVNRVWQFHFGQGLVRSPSDFGKRGGEPTHPHLLDWLAQWFVNEGKWSLKKLHRLIMTSNTYRMGKRSNLNHTTRDANNLLLWRFPYRRLEMEVIRDSILTVSGQLNRDMYGPSMYPFISKAVKRGNYLLGNSWPEFDESDASRRTIYAFIKRTMVLPFFEVLDFCDTVRSADQRSITTVAPQALTLFNGEFVNRQSRHFAHRLAARAGPDLDRQIVLAYRLALGRSPHAREQARALDFLKAEAAHLSRQPAGDAAPVDTNRARHLALVQMCRVILNLNEFVYTD